MMTASAVAFYRSADLEDVAAVAAGENGYLVTIDHTRDLAAWSPDVRSEATDWRYWKPNWDGTSFQEVWHHRMALPLSSAVVMTLQSSRLVAVALANDPKPAFLVSWQAKPGDPPQLGEPSRSGPAFELERQEAAAVKIPPMGDWSTTTLRSIRWLFHPSIVSPAGGPQIAVAMNTADGRAMVWTSNGTDRLSQVARVADALNPVFLRIGDSDRLLFRRMPAGWSVFYHDLRHSERFGPIALPLMMAELGPGGKVARITDLSTDPRAGNVFDFVAGTSGNRLVLAAIAGTKEAPELRIYAAESGGETLHLLESARVRQVPYRLTMATMTTSALIGLAYTTKDGYELEGMVVPLR